MQLLSIFATLLLQNRLLHQEVISKIDDFFYLISEWNVLLTYFAALKKAGRIVNGVLLYPSLIVVLSLFLKVYFC